MERGYKVSKYLKREQATLNKFTDRNRYNSHWQDLFHEDILFMNRKAAAMWLP
jgi:hypothetical protein